jgi:hypothetical protein
LVVASTPTDGTGFAWVVVGSDGRIVEAVDVLPTATVKAAIVFTGAPGKYTVILIVAAKDGTLEKSNASVVIGDAPDPEPEPQPDPQPDPEPGKRFVLVIHETKDRTPDQFATLQGLDRYATEAGHGRTFRDDDETDADGKPLAWLESYKAKTAAAGVALPALIVIEGEKGDGPILGITALPESADKAVAFVKAKGG